MLHFKVQHPHPRSAIAAASPQAAFYVPINVYMHSLLFSLYTFIDTHEANDGQWTSSDKVVSEAAHDWVWAAEDGLLQLGHKRKHVQRGRCAAASSM